LEFNNFFLYRSTCFFEVTKLSFGSTFFCFVIETKLKSLIAINLFGSDLGNYARTCFDDGTRYIFTVLIKNAGHSYFFSD